MAIIIMVIDHLGLYIWSEYQIMRVIGRMAMPIFCFFAGYNFHHKPKIKIFVIGSLLYIFTLFLFKQFVTSNILITIFLGQCYLYFFGDNLNKFFYKGCFHLVLLCSLYFYSWFFIDYGTMAIAIMVLGYIAKHDHANFRLTIIISIILTILYAILNFQFSYIYIIILIILAILEYKLIIFKKFDQKISLNLRIISHNALYIYAIHVAILQFIFLYQNLRLINRF